ncbi:kinase-like protein [Sanghuangporus baumii]|uniref:Kinase-like protein n=1 Tax=Sanghuangporus baumii TaxID=108892 RepID=A0A9Q5NEJ2_SANBA|nr:kinase-like protein [Sanghuangporus baumii]
MSAFCDWRVDRRSLTDPHVDVDELIDDGDASYPPLRSFATFAEVEKHCTKQGGSRVLVIRDNSPLVGPQYITKISVYIMVALDLRRAIHTIPDNIDPAMSPWSRIPSPPIPHPGDPTDSRSQSVPSSSAKPPLKSLSIFTANVAEGLLPSPLPSPREPPSTSSKTAAFFGSPFTATGPPTPAPAPPPLRSDTITTLPQSKEATSRRSATSDFFFAPGALGTRPTPPPSVKSSASSRESSPPRLPPLSRFFPSRYAASSTLGEHDEEPLHHRTKGTDWETNFKREFLSLSKTVPQQPPSPPLAMKPISPPVEHHQLPGARICHGAFHSLPIRRETHLIGTSHGSGDSGFEETLPGSGPYPLLTSDTLLESGSAKLKLVRPLGEGAFSSVWLATDEAGTLVPLIDPDSRNRPETLRRKSSSWAKQGRDKRMQGIKPSSTVSSTVPCERESGNADESVVLHEQDGEGAIASPENIVQVAKPKGKLVAVKMIDRSLCAADDRTRISFHIVHPSIVSYLHSFDSSTHHCLVLEYIGGGELFELVNSDEQFARVIEPAIRRMWGELCLAVGWMHGVGLVHRDIKLENILLTQNIFATGDPLLPSGLPLIKLTDFGLSRFIDPSSPLLSTRCGSESYAAPELVLGASRIRNVASDADDSESSEAKSKGYYDGRQTDAWACGVVLYALATRQLPFDVPLPVHSSSGAPSRAGSVRSNRSTRSVGSGSVRLRPNRRRDMLMRIAQCEYYWPDEVQYSEVDEDEEVDAQIEASRRLASPGLKRVVRMLLERNPTRRARLIDLWNEPWLREEGAPAPPLCASSRFAVNAEHGSETDGEDEWHSQDGVLLDEEHIDSVASRELDPL